MFVWVKQFWSRHWRASVITASVAVGAVVAFSMGVAVGTGRLQVGFFARSHSANSALPTQLDYRTVTEVYRALK